MAKPLTAQGCRAEARDQKRIFVCAIVAAATLSVGPTQSTAAKRSFVSRLMFPQRDSLYHGRMHANSSVQEKTGLLCRYSRSPGARWGAIKVLPKIGQRHNVSACHHLNISAVIRVSVSCISERSAIHDSTPHACRCTSVSGWSPAIGINSSWLQRADC